MAIIVAITETIYTAHSTSHSSYPCPHFNLKLSLKLNTVFFMQTNACKNALSFQPSTLPNEEESQVAHAYKAGKFVLTPYYSKKIHKHFWMKWFHTKWRTWSHLSFLVAFARMAKSGKPSWPKSLVSRHAPLTVLMSAQFKAKRSPINANVASINSLYAVTIKWHAGKPVTTADSAANHSRCALNIGGVTPNSSYSPLSALCNRVSYWYIMAWYGSKIVKYW